MAKTCRFPNMDEKMHKIDFQTLKRTLAQPIPIEWGPDARYIYEERLGIAADLGMDVGIGSKAEMIAYMEAKNEAMRVKV